METAMHWAHFVGVGFWLVAALAGLVAVYAAVDTVRQWHLANVAREHEFWVRGAELADNGFVALSVCFVAMCLGLLLAGAGLAFWEFGG